MSAKPARRKSPRIGLVLGSGGARGLAFYMQRSALSGDRALLDAITGVAGGASST